MKCVIDNQVVLSQPPEGPLAGFIKPFAESLSEQGYALDSIQYQALLAACFSRWLKQKGIRLRRIGAVHRHESVETTQIYLDATLAMKEKALTKTSLRHGKPGRYKPADQLLDFLNNL